MNGTKHEQHGVLLSSGFSKMSLLMWTMAL